jgi:hypothetical protein
MNRRHFLTITTSASTALIATPSVASAETQPTNASSKAIPAEVRRKQGRQDPETVLAFVKAGHNDLDGVKRLVAEDPNLVLASWDWGGGDWETALGGASHTGHREIAKYLLSQGARIDAFCTAMLGQRDVLLAMLAANPSIATTKGPHGYTLLYHAAISGDVAIAEALKSLLAPDAKDYNQALSAAARDGHLQMTKWLLENGVTDPNVPDGFNKTALVFALERNLPAIESELRKHGAHEKGR